MADDKTTKITTVRLNDMATRANDIKAAMKQAGLPPDLATVGGLVLLLIEVAGLHRVPRDELLAVVAVADEFFQRVDTDSTT